MSDRVARRLAARQALAEARLEAERSWWQRRLFAWFVTVPRRVWRSLKWWGRELGGGVVEVLLVWTALGLMFAIGLLAWWAWRTVF